MTLAVPPLDLCIYLNRELTDFRIYRTQIGADSLHDVAIKTFHGSQIETSIISLLNGPFTKVTDYLASTIPKENILLNQEVTEIKFSEPTLLEQTLPIEISTADGSKYSAHHVIFTASLGVLKRSHAKLFSPNLPAKQIAALDLMEMGVVEKVFLEYDSPFWNDLYPNVTNFCLLWGDQTKLDSERRYVSSRLLL